MVENVEGVRLYCLEQENLQESERVFLSYKI
jgi:hypothetical protein